MTKRLSIIAVATLSLSPVIWIMRSLDWAAGSLVLAFLSAGGLFIGASNALLLFAREPELVQVYQDAEGDFTRPRGPLGNVVGPLTFGLFALLMLWVASQ